jgi:2-C-methyl-D-erythritol 4-phosphate cytidylyltransferase
MSFGSRSLDMAAAGIILAAGSGQRLKSITHDKTLLRIGAGAVVSWSVAVFSRAKVVDRLVLVYRDAQQRSIMETEIAHSVPDCPQLHWVQGGERRQDSVWKALQALESHCNDLVFIHDAARPFITVGDLHRLRDAACSSGAAALARPVTDTIKRADVAGRLHSLHLEDLQRSLLYAMETPQVFRQETIREAYRAVQADGVDVTDCVAAYSRAGAPVDLIIPEQNNFKITHPHDVETANFMVHSGSVARAFDLAY